MKKWYYRCSNILGFSRNERMFFAFLIEIVQMIILVATSIGKGVYKAANYINRIVNSHSTVKNVCNDLSKIMNLVYNVTPRQFEILIAELFRQYGYKVKLTAATNDFWRDIILNGNIYVECKHYSTSVVGREICQKLLGSVYMFQAKSGIIVTTGKYHANAYEVEKMCDNLKLMDSWDIKNMISKLKADQISKIITKTLNASI